MKSKVFKLERDYSHWSLRAYEPVICRDGLGRFIDIPVNAKILWVTLTERKKNHNSLRLDSFLSVDRKGTYILWAARNVLKKSGVSLPCWATFEYE